MTALCRVDNHHDDGGDDDDPHAMIYLPQAECSVSDLLLPNTGSCGGALLLAQLIDKI